MSIELVMPSKHLILCRPLLLPPSIFPSIRVFSNESVLLIRWPKDWNFASASLLPMNIHDWFTWGSTIWISLQSKGLSKVFSNTTVQKHQFFGAQLSLLSNSHIHTWLLEKPQFWLDEFCWQRNVSAFYYAAEVGHSFSSKGQATFNFMGAVIICSDFGAPKNKVSHCFHCFPIYLPWSDGTRCHDLSFLDVEL